MIKKVLLGLCLALVFFGNAYSQYEKMYLAGSSVKITQLPRTIRVTWVNDFGILRNNNAYVMGIISQVYTNSAESLSEKLKVSGAHMGYGKVFPTLQNWLALELFSEMSLQYFKSAWRSNFYVEAIQQYREFEYKSGETLWDISVGYGLKINVTQRLYVRQAFTGGGFCSLINHKPLGENAPGINNVNLDFRTYEDIGFQWAVQLAVGYVFK